MADFANSIGTHSGELLDRERNRIEDSFNAEDGGKRLLLSTSTLEMGVDLNSVAAVLQYKLPPGKNEASFSASDGLDEIPIPIESVSE
ncbi:DEAD/DEAH box helicase [Haloferax sp. BAB-2207]|nr:helicase C-terminal domain-containing protein [Haloferax sp. BAB-2207]ELK55777.1 DEAD/DEAH box helicase [Haloferax sp. BAB-2207]